MNTVPKPKLDEKEPEKVTDIKPHLNVVDSKSEEKTTATHNKEKKPFYTESDFWVRVAMGIIFLMAILYFVTLD